MPLVGPYSLLAMCSILSYSTHATVSPSIAAIRWRHYRHGGIASYRFSNRQMARLSGMLNSKKLHTASVTSSILFFLNIPIN